MKTHTRQIMTAVIISLIFILLFSGYAVLYFVVDTPLIIRIGCGVLMTALAVGLVIILIERSRETLKGETDDLSNY